MKFLNWLFEQKQDKEIIFLVGLQSSGKSTYANKHLKGYEIVSNDYYTEVYAKKKGMTYTEAWKEMDYDKDIKAKSMKQFSAAIKAGKNIVIDNTNMTKKSRQWYLDNTPKNYKKIALVFEVPEKVLLKRLKERGEKTGKVIPLDAIENMKAKYEPPKKGEFDEIKRAT